MDAKSGCPQKRSLLNVKLEIFLKDHSYLLLNE